MWTRLRNMASPMLGEKLKLPDSGRQPWTILPGTPQAVLRSWQVEIRGLAGAGASGSSARELPGTRAQALAGSVSTVKEPHAASTRT